MKLLEKKAIYMPTSRPIISKLWTQNVTEYDYQRRAISSAFSPKCMASCVDVPVDLKLPIPTRKGCIKCDMSLFSRNELNLTWILTAKNNSSNVMGARSWPCLSRPSRFFRGTRPKTGNFLEKASGELFEMNKYHSVPILEFWKNFESDVSEWDTQKAYLFLRALEQDLLSWGKNKKLINYVRIKITRSHNRILFPGGIK